VSARAGRGAVGRRPTPRQIMNPSHQKRDGEVSNGGAEMCDTHSHIHHTHLSHRTHTPHARTCAYTPAAGVHGRLVIGRDADKVGRREHAHDVGASIVRVDVFVATSRDDDVT
jgi:hypothetical protein